MPQRLITLHVNAHRISNHGTALTTPRTLDHLQRLLYLRHREQHIAKVDFVFERFVRRFVLDIEYSFEVRAVVDKAIVDCRDTAGLLLNRLAAGDAADPGENVAKGKEELFGFVGVEAREGGAFESGGRHREGGQRDDGEALEAQRMRE